MQSVTGLAHGWSVLVHAWWEIDDGGEVVLAAVQRDHVLPIVPRS